MTYRDRELLSGRTPIATDLSISCLYFEVAVELTNTGIVEFRKPMPGIN